MALRAYFSARRAAIHTVRAIVPTAQRVMITKIFISGSCQILVLTTVLGRPRHAYAKKRVTNYQGPTTAMIPPLLFF
jgi:hypothetical protein